MRLVPPWRLVRVKYILHMLHLQANGEQDTTGKNANAARMPIPRGPALRIRERMMKAHNAGSAYGLRTIVGRTPRRYGSPRAPSPHARLLSIADCGLWRRDRVGGAAPRRPFYSLGPA